MYVSLLHAESVVLLTEFFSVDQSERQLIVNAMKDFETKTCIRFIPRSSQRMYLSIEPRLG